MSNTLTGNMLRINLNSGKVDKEQLDEKQSEMLLGGRSLGAMRLYNELAPGIDPLGPQNKLIMSVGPLVDTIAPGSSRYCVHTKSPLTGLYLMSISSGHFGPKFKRTGHDMLIVEAVSDKPVYVLISEDRVEIRDARHLWGMTTELTQEFIKRELHDEDVGIACIGPAGEHLVPFASIVNERRVAGRGGAGAVMGSKNLKAIVVRGTRRRSLPDQGLFREAVQKAVAETRLHPETAEGIRLFGSCSGLGTFYKNGIMPFLNWREATSPQIRELLPETLRKKYLVKDSHCAPPCHVKCAKQTLVRDGEHAGAFSEGPEYETVYSFGSCLNITDLAAVIEADQICDSYGLDTISMGVSLAFATECFEKGIIGSKDTGGLELRFGESRYLNRIIRDSAYRRGFGEVLSQGTRKMAGVFGKGSETFAMHAKGMELGGYDPRGAKGIALIFACGPRGGCHHAGGYTSFAEIAMGKGRFASEGKGALVKRTRDRRVLCDSAIVCTFVSMGISDDSLAGMLTGATGLSIGPKDLYVIGDRASNIERAFNVREGLRRSWDTLPERLLRESPSTGPTSGQTVDLDRLVADFYGVCGWNVDSGIPAQQKLNELGLTEIARDLARLPGHAGLTC